MTKCPSQFKYEATIRSLFACIGLLSIMYIGFFVKTISNTVERQRGEREIKNLSADVSELEFAYLNNKSLVTMDYAKSLGFIEAKDVYVAKQSSGGLTMRR